MNDVLIERLVLIAAIAVIIYAVVAGWNEHQRSVYIATHEGGPEWSAYHRDIATHEK